MVNQPTLLKSFQVAFEGIYHALRENRNLWIHLIIAALVIVASIILRVSRVDFVVLIVMIVLVIASEMINTSLEEMTDLITNEHKKEAKAAKDVAAGMVLVTSLGALVVGIVIFLPYIVAFLGY